MGIAVLLFTGCGKESNPAKEREKVKQFVSNYLNTPQYNVKIHVEMEMEENLSRQADIIGRYHGETIAVIFDNEIINTAPVVSPRIDYILEFPPGNIEIAHSAMESLKDAGFTPVLAQRKELGIIEPFEDIKASFTLRNTSEGKCRIEDEDGITSASFSLQRNSDHIFSLPENSGFGLSEGKYSIVCDFSNEENLSVDDLRIAGFSLSHYELPRYSGGLKNINCIPGRTKKLNAHFTPKNGELHILYYKNDAPMESNIFKCDKVGSYTIKAVATDKKGFTAGSPEIRINVVDVPEGMINPDKFEYGEQYEWPFY